VLHGTYREWHQNGQLAVEQVNEYGIRLSKRAWDEQGRLVEEYAIAEGGRLAGFTRIPETLGRKTQRQMNASGKKETSR
jgi:hypothetical protein